ncbi:MAG: hypothetical protein LBT45_00050 [Rickettsiales bacterium]|nr:hypothetical protein [Rickettsiales bacterium]
MKKLAEISEILRLDNLSSDNFTNSMSPLSKFLTGKTNSVPAVNGATSDELVKMRDNLRFLMPIIRCALICSSKKTGYCFSGLGE